MFSLAKREEIAVKSKGEIAGGSATGVFDAQSENIRSGNEIENWAYVGTRKRFRLRLSGSQHSFVSFENSEGRPSIEGRDRHQQPVQHYQEGVEWVGHA